MVVGHKNPDTDSICSALAYAHYKRQVLGEPAVPYRAGSLNPQTSFVLDHFGVPAPELITTFLPKLADIMIQGKNLSALAENDPLGIAQEIITQRRFAFLPVTGDGGKYAGKISALRLAGLPQDLGELCRKRSVPVRFLRLITAIAGRVDHGQVPDCFQGRVWLPGLAEAPPDGELPLLAVLPDGSEAGLTRALERGASAIVLCATEKLTAGLEHLLRGRAVCVVSTLRYALEVAGQICLSMPLREFIDRESPTFKPYDLVRDVQKAIRKYNEGGFIVVDDDGYICGVITRVSFMTQWRFRVALVDHNELSQAIDGVEEASVEEIIDHHRLGYRSTDQPITFINKVVGCTSTIIAELFQNSRQTPPREIAGLMLAAILSDTVILQSPTTTPLDRELAQWLAGLAGEELAAFGAKMFAAGCAVEGADPHKLIRQDLKVYEESGWKISVSQMETVGFESFKGLRQAMATELRRAQEEAHCHFSCLMVTDITSSSSLLLCSGDEQIIHAISYPRVGENLFEMHGVLSRKKQMVPHLVELLRGLPNRNSPA